MTTSPSFGPEIGVLYALYAKSGGKYEPVTRQSDLALEAALAGADYRKLVASAAPPQQEGLLLAHVEGVLEGTVFLGHQVDLSSSRASRWDPPTRSWKEVIRGAALYFAVPGKGEQPEAARLWLNVWTADCLVETPPEATAEA
jgi:hypothetical protein